MKKITLIFLISLFSVLSIHAQRTDLVYSAEKNAEKDFSTYKIEILNNGNTANIGLNAGVGFFCTLYDANKKTIAHTIVPTTFEIKVSVMKSVFEVNNEIVVFILSSLNDVPILSRYIFDGVSGKLKKEEIVLSKPVTSKIKVMSPSQYANMIPPDFFIQKDPNSDYYAVGYFDYWATDINKKIEVIHYSPTHEIVSKAYLANPEIKYLKLHHAALYVNGGKSVILSSYLYNLKDDKIKENEACFYISELKAGTTNFRSLKALETAYYHKGEALFIFNKVTNKVQLISVIWVNDEKGKNGGYNIVSQTLNVETLALTGTINLYSNKLDAAYMAAYSGQHYRGFPQHYSVNSKGNILILSQMATYEELGTAQLSEIGISSWTPAGKDTYGTLIHYINTQGTKTKSFIYARGLNGQYAYGNYFDEYVEMYVGLISGKSNSYLFFNNTVERFEMGDKPPIIWNSVSSRKPKFTSFVYTLNDEGVVSKEYIFGKPTSETDAKYCRFNTADYDPATGLYAVIVVDRIKGKKTVSVLWMNLK
jgi:hypothetical protein